MDTYGEGASHGYFSSSDSDDGDRTNNLIFTVLEHQMRMEHSEHQPKHRGSTMGRRNVSRDRAAGHERLIADYFANPPVYQEDVFRRRFRMSSHLFKRILNELQAHDSYFVRKFDALGRISLSGEQKMTAALRVLAYGVAADSIDEYVRIGESTTIECLKRFCSLIISIFGPVYLREPNVEDIARLLHKGEERGFPGMLGSLDCMHWEWKNCPTAYHGQYTGHVHRPTIILEAVASYDLWIWHAFFGMPGGNNDINVLDASNLFSSLAEGNAPPCNFVVNGTNYNQGYYLADGIYPKWATIVQTISQPQGRKRQLFAQRQESYRKDVERAFGVLQARFAIVKGPARFWRREDLARIMKACIILHNMIIEEERIEDDNNDVHAVHEEHVHENVDNLVEPTREPNERFNQFISRHEKIRDKNAHFALRNDIIEHIWDREGDM